MKSIVELFLTFFKIGLFTFGGGYAMISVVEDQCVEQKKWITQEEMVQMTVLAESTPGPVAINAATYVGFQRAGLSGAAAATLGVVLPSFGVIFLISQFLEGFLEIPLIASAFQGIKLGVGVLIFRTGLQMTLKAKMGPLTKGIFLASFLAMLAAGLFSLPVSSVALLVLAGILGFSVYWAKGAAK